MQKIDEIKIYKESEIRIHILKVRDNRTRAELTENTICTQVEYKTPKWSKELLTLIYARIFRGVDKFMSIEKHICITKYNNNITFTLL